MQEEQVIEKKLAWGIIGTGSIAKKFAKGLAECHRGTLVAVGSRSQESADAFGDEFNVPVRHGSYEALLDDPGVEAVYISTPHPMHAEWAIKAAEAGKHILCEKPITLNYPEAMAVVDAARRNDVFLMEAFMYRCHPQTHKLVELIKEGAIGDVRLIQATFSFHAGWNPESRLLASELGGGGILDVGCYCTSMSRLIAGAAHGKPFEDPLEVKAVGHIGETGVDEWTSAVLKFPGDIIAQLSTGVQLNQENVVRIYGSNGSIVIPSPWFCGKGEGGANIIVTSGSKTESIDIDEPGGLYSIEADTVAEYIDQRQAAPPAMTPDDTLGNMRTLDSWRLQIGLLYPNELPQANFPTADRRPLTVRDASGMKYGRIAGIEKPVSRMVMGSMPAGAQIHLPHMSMIFDEFYRRGGNTFDTAYVYRSDAVFGQWVKNRGIREEVVIIGKGAHTPECYPEALTRQLFESLDMLQTDYMDIYLMHRDNPEVPVGEFVDVLNEHQRAGRMSIFGGSNWSLERIDAANAYAKSKGLMGFSAVSNNFSLARMIDPVWSGCLANSDAQSRAWFTKNQMPLLAWSSLARGFFAVGDPKKTNDPSMVRCWYSPDNFARLERARTLAKKRGVEAIQIAAAYTLNQPFPVWALFGPASISEMNISLQGLDLELTPDEMRWLNLED